MYEGFLDLSLSKSERWLILCYMSVVYICLVYFSLFMDFTSKGVKNFFFQSEQKFNPKHVY